MKVELYYRLWVLGLKIGFLGFMVQFEGCTTAELTPPQMPTPPSYTQVPHPRGNDLSEIRSLFLDPGAPSLDMVSKNCDLDLKKLFSLTQSIEERTQGVAELVRQDPVSYHWCFYGKLLSLENLMSSSNYLDERQKEFLEIYDILVPIAKSFSSQFHDTRYLRVAIYRYKRLSEWLFFRKVDLTPEGTLELVQPENPFGLWRENEGGFSILEKYHLTKPRENSFGVSPISVPVPVSEPSTLPAESLGVPVERD